MGGLWKVWEAYGNEGGEEDYLAKRGPEGPGACQLRLEGHVSDSAHSQVGYWSSGFAFGDPSFQPSLGLAYAPSL
ncbi:hypothetical protein U1Q18_028449 [Sarracenia purpurea var. burkii]